MNPNVSPLIRSYYEDKHCIKYRREFALIAESALSAIFLQQVLYRFIGNDCQPFYKFGYPCDHTLYREGDSWVEETAFTRREFESARSKVATKITKGVKKSDLMKFDEGDPITINRLVLYWTDADKLTWYWLNIPMLEKSIAQHFLYNAGIRHRLEMPESDIVLFTENTRRDRRKEKMVNVEHLPRWYSIVGEYHKFYGGRADNFILYLTGHSNGKKSLEYSLPQSFIEPDTYKEFLSWYRKKYPSRNYVLDLEKVQSAVIQWQKEKEHAGISQQQSEDTYERLRAENELAFNPSG